MFEQQKEKIKALWPFSMTKEDGSPLKCWIAGGAITSVVTGAPVNDVDMYFGSKRDLYEAVALAYEESLWCVAASKRALTFKDYNGNTYQFIMGQFHDTAESIFENFDFTINMAALRYDGELEIHKSFVDDVCSRTLRFNPGTLYPICSAIRVNKYKGRGYTMTDGEYLKVLLAIAALDIKSWDDTKDQLGEHYGEEPGSLAEVLHKYEGWGGGTTYGTDCYTMPASTYIEYDMDHLEVLNTWLEAHD